MVKELVQIHNTLVNKDYFNRSLVAKEEQLILSILKQETITAKILWKQIDKDARNGFEVLAKELNFNKIKERVLKLYWWYISRLMVREARNNVSLTTIEKKLGRIMKVIFKDKKVRLPYLRRRAQRSFEKIKNEIIGGSVLDLGCGDGMLLKILSKNFEVLGIDVIDYRSEENIILPFAYYCEGDVLDLPDKCVENTILWTVLHHSDDPAYLLKEAVRVTTKRIIIVEGYKNNPYIHKINCFFDWFLNRPGKNIDVNVPFNYKTTDEWKKIFQDLNCKLISEKYLGIDEPVAPERHVIFVIDPCIS